MNILAQESIYFSINSVFPMIIGVTGKYCSGKDTVAEYLMTKGFFHLSLSDVIREEAKKRSLKPTRDNLIKIGNELRETFGHAVLAQKTIENMKPDQNHVITSIRNPAEVQVLKTRKDFVLINVESPEKVRFSRMQSRNRIGDPKTYEEFMAREKEEQSSDPNKQQLHKTIGMASLVINNNSTLESLNKKTDRMLQDWAPKLQLKRPNWDEYFMQIAREVASRSNCIKRKVAAIIVKDKRIISTGYNGTPRGTKNCNEGGCKRCNSFAKSGTGLTECRCSHGEENSIVQASYHGVSLNCATLYSTFSPCMTCSKMIINAGIKEVVFNSDYPLAEDATLMLKESGVKLRQFKLY